jgi:hypothetical protein
MLTKTRASIIALVASVGFATAAIAPAVSSAQKLEPGPHAALCEVTRLTYELLDELQERAFANGQEALAEYYASEEKAAYDEASAEGCGWPTAAVIKGVWKLPVGIAKLPVGITIKPIANKPAAVKKAATHKR